MEDLSPRWYETRELLEGINEREQCMRSHFFAIQANNFVKKQTKTIELVTTPDTRHHIQLVAKGAEVVGYTANIWVL